MLNPFRISAPTAVFLAVCLSAAGADDFLPGAGRDFFERESPPPAVPAVASRGYYSWAVDAGIRSFGLSAPAVAGVELEWSPLPHLGLSVGAGALFDGLASLNGPAHEYWSLSADYLAFADAANWSAYRQIYQIAYYGELPVLNLDAGLSLYLGSRGLRGLFVGVAAGAYIALAEPTYYFDWDYQAPIKAVDGGPADLPHQPRVSISFCPYIGYKLAFAGFFVEPKLGYSLTPLGTANGYTLFVTAGYALGGR